MDSVSPVVGSVARAMTAGGEDAKRAGRSGAAVSPAVVDAALRCIARWGLSKTTLDDVAREAGLSRATLYRSFPGGKTSLLRAVRAAETHRVLSRVRDAVEATDNLEDALVAAMHETGVLLDGHAALQYLLHHEPGSILPSFAFGPFDELLRIVRAIAGPLLARFVDGDLEVAERLAEWVARVSLSYTFSPSVGVRTTDVTAVRTLVQAFFLPGVSQLQGVPA